MKKEKHWHVEMKIVLMAIIICASPAFALNIAYISPDGVIQFNTDHPLTMPSKEKVQKNYNSLILKAQKKYGIEAALIKAIMHAESAFDSEAVSKKGAAGLMQIMPMNFKSLRISDPFNPEQNIMGGTVYLKAMLERYNFNLPLALAAYNAGPEKVDKHNNQIPPYEETVTYIKKVIHLYNRYKKE